MANSINERHRNSIDGIWRHCSYFHRRKTFNDFCCSLSQNKIKVVKREIKYCRDKKKKNNVLTNAQISQKILCVSAEYLGKFYSLAFVVFFFSLWNESKFHQQNETYLNKSTNKFTVINERLVSNYFSNPFPRDTSLFANWNWNQLTAYDALRRPRLLYGSSADFGSNNTINQPEVIRNVPKVRRHSAEIYT